MKKMFELSGDFVTPREVTRAHVGAVYTDEQIGTLTKSLMGINLGGRHGYVLMPAPPTEMSVSELHDFEPAHFHAKNGGRWKKQTFSYKEQTSFGWLAVRMTHVPCSSNIAPVDQEVLLSGSDEIIPNAIVVVWCAAVYKAVRNMYLFQNVLVRTSSVDDDGHPIVVGMDSPDGIIIRSWKDGKPDGMIGLAAARSLAAHTFMRSNMGIAPNGKILSV